MNQYEQGKRVPVAYFSVHPTTWRKWARLLEICQRLNNRNYWTLFVSKMLKGKFNFQFPVEIVGVFMLDVHQMELITQHVDADVSWLQRIDSEDDYHKQLKLIDRLFENYDANLKLIDLLCLTLEKYKKISWLFEIIQPQT
jgi:hypothetical protein